MAKNKEVEELIKEEEEIEDEDSFVDDDEDFEDFEDFEEEERIEKQNEQDISKDNIEFVGETLQQIKKQESKLKEELKFDLDTHYYFTIVFRSTEERNEFLKKYKIQLENYDHCIYEEIKHIFKDVKDVKGE